jgi:hypothetical protein
MFLHGKGEIMKEASNNKHHQESSSGENVLNGKKPLIM